MNSSYFSLISFQTSRPISASNPFSIRPPGIKTATWVQPKLVAEVEFSEWTQEGRLRHPSFKGLREDKAAKDVIHEKAAQVVKIENKSAIKLSHPDKILYPEENITKGQVFEYYTEIAPYILPYITNRPLTLLRCPANYHECFYQKHVNAFFDESLLSIPITGKNDSASEEYIYLNDKKGLQALVQMGVLEIHPWGCMIGDLERPDILVFDLDPSPEIAWEQIVEGALQVKHYLSELKLKSFVKTTGGKGLHVVVPIQPQHSWDKIKLFSNQFVRLIEKQYPEKYLSNMSKAKRKGKIFLDYLRNQRGANAIAPFSTRARLHAPMATPLDWDELDPKNERIVFNLFTLPKRLSEMKDDPWKDFFRIKQQLDLDS